MGFRGNFARPKRNLNPPARRYAAKPPRTCVGAVRPAAPALRRTPAGCRLRLRPSSLERWPQPCCAWSESSACAPPRPLGTLSAILTGQSSLPVSVGPGPHSPTLAALKSSQWASSRCASHLPPGVVRNGALTIEPRFLSVALAATAGFSAGCFLLALAFACLHDTGNKKKPSKQRSRPAPSSARSSGWRARGGLRDAVDGVEVNFDRCLVLGALGLAYKRNPNARS